MKVLDKIFLGISSIFFAKESIAQAKKSPEKFAVIQAKLTNGKPVIGSINMAYKNYSEKKLYPWCLKINMALDLKGVTADGLPINAESTLVNKLEDELLDHIRKITPIQYVGHLYNDTFLDIYLYLNNPEKVNDFLKVEVNRKGLKRGFRYEIKQDVFWSEVQGFLK